MIMLAMTILVHFWMVYWDTEPPATGTCICTLKGPTSHTSQQPSMIVWTVRGAFYVH